MSAPRAATLLRLFDETVGLFHRLRAIAGEVHGDGVPSAGRRGVLRSLDRLGPRTVPQLARERPVSRQHVQVLVNGLLADGLVVLEDNPAHRKSALVRLTAKGKRELTEMQAREMELLAKARPGLAPEQIENAANTLRSLRNYLESEEWRADVARKQ